MSDKENQRNQKPAASTDVGQDEVQQKFDEANEQGYFGVTTDPTPDENYTLQGRTANKPTPETDDEARAAARKEAGFR